MVAGQGVNPKAQLRPGYGITPTRATSVGVELMENNKIVIPVERVQQAIYLIRGQRVMLDRDLARLYGVETRVLNQAVRRNTDRFPADFIFELTRKEILRISQFVTSSDVKFSKNVYAFTWANYQIVRPRKG